MEEKSINTNYTLEAEILTPVHVGAGAEKDWLKNIDFVYEKGKVYLLDHKKVIDAIGVDKFAHALTAPKESSLIGMLPGPLKAYASRVLLCNVNTSNDIKAHVRAGIENTPIIPGSSLKGALRSVIIHHLQPVESIQKNSELNTLIMGSSIEGDEFGRFFKVSDINFDDTELTNTKIWNLTGHKTPFSSGWKHALKNGTKPRFDALGFNTIYETLTPGQKGIFSFSLAVEAWKNLSPKDFYLNQQRKLHDRKINLAKKSKRLQEISSLEALVAEKTYIVQGDIKNIFRMINDFTRIYLEKEIAFFEKYNQAENSNKILESLVDLRSLIPSDDSYGIMRLAAGSGFHSITGDWKLESHEIDSIVLEGKSSRGKLGEYNSAKSRKIAVSNGAFMPMGFIKLREITKAEIQAREEQERQKREEKARKKAEENRQREAERIRNQKIHDLLSCAEALAGQKQFEQALKKIAQAELLLPNDKHILAKKANIEKDQQQYLDERVQRERLKALEEQKIQNAKEEKKRQQANEKYRAKQQQNTLQQGLEPLEKMNDYDEGRKYIEQYFVANNQNISSAQLPFLERFIRQMIYQKPKDWKKLNKGKWKLVIKWVGKELAAQWFNKMK